jgi:hypothetical protein
MQSSNHSASDGVGVRLFLNRGVLILRAPLACKLKLPRFSPAGTAAAARRDEAELDVVSAPQRLQPRWCSE